MSAEEGESAAPGGGWGSVKRKMRASAAASTFVNSQEVQSKMSELSTIFSGLGEWQITRHAQFLVDDTLAKVAEMSSAEMRKQCRDLGVEVEGDLDGMLADELRAALEKHFREASELIKQVGRGEKHGVWEDQHVVALLQGFQRWYDEPSGSGSQESKDFEERQDMVFSLSKDGVGHFTHAEKEQIVHDLGLLDQDARAELMNMLSEVEAMRAQREQLDVAREVAEDAVNAPPDESLQEILQEIAEKEGEVQRLGDSLREAVIGAGLGDMLGKQQQGQDKAMEVLVDAPGTVDATFEPGDRGRGAVVRALTRQADHSPLADSGLVRPGMVLTEVNGVGTLWLKHSAVLTLLADTNAEPRRVLRFRSPERHAYLRRVSPEEGKPAGEVTLRVETWMATGAAKGTEGGPSIKDVAELPPRVRVVVERVSGLPRGQVGGEEATVYRLRPELGDEDETIELPAACADGGDHVCGDAYSAEFKNASNDAPDLAFRVVEERDWKEYDGESVPLQWTGEAPDAHTKEEERDGVTYHVVWTSSTYEVYPGGKRPEQVQEQAKAAAEEGAGEDAGEDDIRPAENRATFRGVTIHPGYGEDEDELFAPGEEHEATHLKRLGAVLKLKGEGDAAAESAKIKEQTEALEKEIAELRGRVQELEEKLKEQQAKAEEETKEQRQVLEAAQEEAGKAKEELEAEQRALEAKLAEEAKAKSDFRKAEDELDTVLAQIQRLEAQIEVVKEASAMVDQQAKEEMEDMDSVSPAAFVRFFEFRTRE